MKFYEAKLYDFFNNPNIPSNYETIGSYNFDENIIHDFLMNKYNNIYYNKKIHPRNYPIPISKNAFLYNKTLYNVLTNEYYVFNDYNISFNNLIKINESNRLTKNSFLLNNIIIIYTEKVNILYTYGLNNHALIDLWESNDHLVFKTLNYFLTKNDMINYYILLNTLFLKFDVKFILNNVDSKKEVIEYFFSRKFIE